MFRSSTKNTKCFPRGGPNTPLRLKISERNIKYKQILRKNIELKSAIFQSICFVTPSVMAKNIASCNTLCNGQVALREMLL